MWLKKIRQKKLQYILIALILFFTSAIFSTCLSFVVESDDFAKRYYARGELPDGFFSTVSQDAVDEFVKKAKDNKDITGYDISKGAFFDETIYCNGKELNPTDLTAHTLTNYKKLPYHFEIVTGDTKILQPSPGEVWLPQLYHDLYEIKVGDTIAFGKQNFSLKVTHLINTPLLPNGTASSGITFFINESDLNQLKDVTTGYNIDLSLSDDAIKNETPIEFFSRTIGDLDKFTYGKMEVKSLIACVTINVNMMAGIGLIAAFMILAVSIVIIQVVVRTNLLKEYRSVGVYKAQGFTNAKIRGIYVMSYAVTGAVALFFGAICGFPFANIVCKYNFKYLSGFSLTYRSVLICIATAIVLLLIVIISVNIATKRIKKISPVAALQIGLTSSKQKLTESVIKNARTPFSMAINDVFKRKIMSLITILILSISFFLCIYFSSLYNTVSHLTKYSNIWFSFPKAELFISGTIDDKLVNYVKNDSRVQDYNVGSPYCMPAIKIDKKYGIKGNAMADSISIISMDQFSDKWGLKYEQGRGPKNENEVALSNSIVSGTSLKVGDYIDIEICNSKKSYLITGIYGAMIGGGMNIQLTSDTIRELDENYKRIYISVNLKNKTDEALFKSDLLNKFESTTVESHLSSLDDAILSIEQLSVPATITLTIVFILFSLLNIINCIIMDNANNRKTYGILKALGFTTSYINRRILWKMVILSLVGIIVALLANALFASKLFYMMLSIDGLVSNPILIAVLIMTIFTLIILVTLICCIPIRKIAPTELMEE